jgi:excinuclease ABC subunit A
VETALKLGEGNCIALAEEGSDWIEHRFSERFACPDHPECALEELEPRLFSFNSPQGACSACAGLGQVQEFDPDLVVNDPDLGVAEGAIEPWRRNGRRMNIYYSRLLRGFCKFFKVSPETPFSKLNPRIRRYLMEGIPEAEEAELGVSFEGVMPNLKRRYEETESEFVKERLLAYMSSAPCHACAGRRLKPAALAVKVRGGVVRRAQAHQVAGEDRGADPEGDRRAARLPAERGPGIPHARSRQRHALGRRGAAHPAGHAGGQRACRRVLRARRTHDRPAPARQRPPGGHAAAPDRHRQHGDRGGA